jgi:DNA-binding GntR family transcriptional regulator
MTVSAGRPSASVLARPAHGLADQIAVRLEADILGGRYAPGAHLRQETLCARLGVSRTPVREALRKLQAQNLVVLTPNTGATVRRPDRREVTDSYVLRAELEGFACELAAGRMDAAAFLALDQAIAALGVVSARLEHGLDDAEAPGLHEQVAGPDEAFHAAIHAAAANSSLRATLDELGRQFLKDHAWRAVQGSSEARRVNVEDHQRIRDALARADGAGARAVMREHMLRAGRLLVRHLDARGFWAGETLED